jgi:hypothetical protein
MTSTSGITSTGPIATATQAAVAPSALTNVASPKTFVQSQTVSISPRIIDNASAGVIVTEYLDSSGKVVSQNPSSTVIAYLRAGLTAQGLSKHPFVSPEASTGSNTSTGTVA